MPQQSANAWRRFVSILIAGFAGVLAAALALVVLMNPYGNLPKVLFSRHVIMDSDQRFQYPSIIRSGDFDSAVIGTSSSRLLEPGQLESTFGGHFANLAINDARAWEQTQVTRLFLRNVVTPRTIVFGLDWVWCSAEADQNRTRGNEFPEWLYDDNPWNDWQYVLNGRTIEISLRKLGYHIGIGKPRFPANGYEVFVPPDGTYNAAKASAKIWDGPPRAVVPIEPPAIIAEAERRTWRFPALAWLEDLVLAAPRKTRLVFVFVPAHIAALPQPGSMEVARIAACKHRVVEIAGKVDAPVVDFRFPSTITRSDLNFWDSLHYRLPIASRIVAGLGAAVIDGTGAANDGTWRRIDGGRNLE